MALSTRIHQGDFDDFRGNNHLDFSQLDKAKAARLLALFQTSTPQANMLELYENNHDELCRGTVYLLSRDSIAREQAVVILEWVALYKSSIPSTTHNLFDDNGDLNPILLTSLNESKLNKNVIEKFTRLAKILPASDQCFYQIKLTDEFPPSESITQFINLLTITKLFFETTEKHCYLVLSASARNAMTKALYGPHAKTLMHRLGLLSINDIERSIRQYGRYSAVYYPDTLYPPSFHGIAADIFFVMMHDEVHRQFISAIGNPVYVALLAAIDMVRTKTGIHWTKEVWNAFDMEIFRTIYTTGEMRNITDPVSITHEFILLLLGLIYSTQTPIGLFTPSPLNDTAWLLMIDLQLDPDKWKRLRIEGEMFSNKSSKFHTIYSFTSRYIYLIAKIKSPAAQVAFIKQQYFHLGEIKEDECSFQLDEMRYINVMHGGKCIVLEKYRAMNLLFRSHDTNPVIATYPAERLQMVTSLPSDLMEKIDEGLLILLLADLVTADDLQQLLENKRADLFNLLSISWKIILELTRQNVPVVRDVMQALDHSSNLTVSYLNFVKAGNRMPYAEFLQLKYASTQDVPKGVASVGMFGGRKGDDIEQPKNDDAHKVLDL